MMEMNEKKLARTRENSSHFNSKKDDPSGLKKAVEIVSNIKD